MGRHGRKLVAPTLITVILTLKEPRPSTSAEVRGGGEDDLSQF